MKVKRILSFFSLLLFFSSSFLTLNAAVPKNAKYKRKRLNTEIYLSPRALGRGNTYITTASGQDSLFLNPALLPMPKEGIYDRTYILDPTIISSGRVFTTVKDVSAVTDLFSSSSSKGSSEQSESMTKILKLVETWKKEPTSVYSSVFFGSFFKYVGFGVLASGTGDLDSGVTTVDDRGESLRVNALLNVAPSLAIAYPVLPDLLLGGAFRYIFRVEVDFEQNLDLVELLSVQENAPTLKKLMGFDHKPAFDLGLVYRPDIFLKPRFGVVFANIGNVNFKDRDNTADFEMEPIRQNLGLGVSIHPKLGPGVLTASLDFRDLTASYDTSFLSEMYLGVDYLLKEMFGFSVGLGQGYPSASLYFTSHYFQMDVGFYTKERGLKLSDKADPRFFLKFAFSF